jgi:hypothetical protein
VIDRRTAFGLVALHFFEEQFFDELIDESGIDTCAATRPKLSAILQDVLANHLDVDCVGSERAELVRAPTSVISIPESSDRARSVGPCRGLRARVDSLPEIAR